LAEDPKEQELLDAQEFLTDGLVAYEVPAGIERALADSLSDFGRARFRSEDNLVELALIRIDWAKPDSLLKEEWESYIKIFRPMVHPNKPLIGKTSPDSTRQRQLEQLGRYRLVRHHGSVALARRATGQVNTSDDNPWYRAVKTVKELLRDAETKIPLLSREALVI
jgi:hypothetical protein